MEKIGKYEVVAKIGEGGFGVVYQARDPFIKRPVALKTCTSQLEDVRRRFFREAEITGNLHHPNIVTIHDFGLDGETPFIVQEFLGGEDLDRKIAADPKIALATKVGYLLQIGAALGYAHSEGVIHRDVKPSNIRILEGDRVKVMDFGIARLKDQQTQLTEIGTTLGTVAYLSPEQLRGKEIDNRTDIFSFGILAYELLCRLRPFEADTLPKLFYQLIHRPPPSLSERAADCPSELVNLVERCLEKEAERRYPDFKTLVAELEPIANRVGEGREAEPQKRQPAEIDQGDTLPDTGAAGSLGATQAGRLHRLLHLADEARRALDAGDLTAAELTLSLARREHGEEEVAERLADLIEDIESQKQIRDSQALEASELLLGGDAPEEAKSDGPPAGGREGPGEAEAGALEDTAGQRQRLFEEEVSLVESLLEEGKVEEAGIHVARLRSLFSKHPTFRSLQRRFRAARQSKIEGRDGVPPFEEAGVEGDAVPASGEDGGRPALFATGPLSPLERELAVDVAARAIATLLGKGQVQEAARSLSQARSELHDDPAFVALEERIGEVRRQSTLHRLVADAQKAVAGEDYRHAQELLLEALKLDPEHAEAKATFKRAAFGLHRQEAEASRHG